MFFYKICGHTFRSYIPIHELVACGEQEPDFTVQLCDEALDTSEACLWLKHWYTPDGSVWLAFAKVETGYLLRFPEYADYIVSMDGRYIRCYLREACPLETMRHLLLNQVIPLVLNQLGHLVLHASACAMTSQGAIAFMGMTGMGKSTLAASFGLHGFTVLTDDCLLIEEQDGITTTVASYPGLRLWPESVTALFDQEPELRSLAHYTDKKRLLLDQSHFERRIALRAIYVLTQPEDFPDTMDMTITPLAASEALLETLKHTFQLDTIDRLKLGRAFKQYENLVRSVPFYKLSYPRDFTLLSAVNKLILDHLDHIQNQVSTPN